ncbi:MAG: NADH-quinone oxidoreductase subunit N [Anaerolineae bacterium]|nr:NADH-quinone oxidoreductase subunit N [Anaerolineae bacterium]
MPAIASFEYLLPTMVLLAGALLVLLLDLLAGSERIASVAWPVTVLSVLGAAAASFTLVDQGPLRVLSVLAYDGFTAYMWRLILLALAMVVLLSESYIRNHSREPGLYYACVLFFGLGALVLAASSNLIMLLLAVDFLSLVGYVLTGFLHYDKRSTEAAIKYLIYGSAVSAMMAYGLSWLYGLAGSADYASTAEMITRGVSWPTSAMIQPFTLVPVLIFILAGFSFKIGSAPFHQWLPDAFEGAPAPVAAALAIVPKLSGFAALARFTMVTFPEGTTLGGLWRWPLVAFLAVGAMFVGNLIGLWQTNIKRLMAYSGIAQVGYALIGVATASDRGLSGLLLYLTAYTVAEIGAFAAITVMSDRVGLETVEDYRGLYHRSPALSAVLLISVLSLFGMPGTGGFMGKLWLFTSAVEDGRFGLLVVAALNSVLSLAYYWKIIRTTFIHTDYSLEPVSVPLASTIVLALSVAGVLLIGLYPNLVLAWAETAIQAFR